MKPGLKRIEATLDQLEVHNDSSVGIAEENSDFNSDFNSADLDRVNITDRNITDRHWHEQHSTPHAKTKSKLQVEPFPLPRGNDAVSGSVSSNLPSKDQKEYREYQEHTEHTEALLPVLPPDNPVEPVASITQDAASELSSLSATDLSAFSVHRQAANPNLAIGLLKEIETLVRGWQKDLDQTIQQIQVVYQDGPIVDGWLESYPPGKQTTPPSTSVSMLRHAEIEHLMEFIEQICKAEQAQITEDMRRTSYRLCGLDPDGKVWSRPCPSEQVPYVSLAIARYQKLRTLLSRKQKLETRLTSLVESLTMLHGHSREG